MTTAYKIPADHAFEQSAPGQRDAQTMPITTTQQMVLDAASKLYPGSAFREQVQRMRPHICPFELLVDQVPQGSNVLDIGCGSGLFLGLLAELGDIRSGVGFDANGDAVAMAQSMALRSDAANKLSFKAVAVEEPWPEGQFDVISMVDVMHHIPGESRAPLFDMVADRLAAGGLFLYKDMAQKPVWRALGNRIHDLVMAREWISYEPIADVVSACAKRGLSLTHSEDKALYWYGHELRVFRKTA